MMTDQASSTGSSGFFTNSLWWVDLLAAVAVQSFIAWILWGENSDAEQRTQTELFRSVLINTLPYVIAAVVFLKMRKRRPEISSLGVIGVIGSMLTWVHMLVRGLLVDTDLWIMLIVWGLFVTVMYIVLTITAMVIFRLFMFLFSKNSFAVSGKS
ncbi:MAG: hypothetical protein KF855_10835 [Acidobacteria bacterium]|nr:hypothetical protein [Acidobacteriota bacterium]